MKCIIIYFSLTGNTETIAKAIQAGVKRAAGHCDIVKLKEANWRRLYRYDLIGLGCPPMLDHVEPPNVKAFIKNMRFVGGKHAFAFATHGTHPEFFFPSIVPNLKSRGLVVIGTYSCYAASYLSSAPWPYPTSGHPDEIDLKEAEAFGMEMVARSRRIAAGETGLIPPVPEPPEPDPEHEKAMARMTEAREARGIPPVRDAFQALRKFHKELCRYPKCRLCMDNCPMDGIDLSMDPPVIGESCFGCTFCAKICPTGAMDESAMIEATSPADMRQMMSLFYLPELAKAEAEGRFRRLVPLDKIGYDTPIYKLHNKHPQWIIGKGLQ